MWRILLAIGVLMIIVGSIVYGRSPIVALGDMINSGTNNTNAVTATVESAVNIEQPVSLVVEVSATPKNTATVRPSATPRPTATEPPTATPLPKKLRFYRKSLDDDARCVSMQIRGINVTDWTFRVNGTRRVATFDGGGNARMCGFKRGQEFLFTVYNTRNIAVVGGVDIPSKGGAIMIADWQ